MDAHLKPLQKHVVGRGTLISADNGTATPACLLRMSRIDPFTDLFRVLYNSQLDHHLLDSRPTRFPLQPLSPP